MRFTFLSMIIVLFSFNAIANIQDSYNRAKQYENSIRLGNTDQMGNKVIFDKDAYISNLSQMNDQDLTKQGGQMLNNSSAGQLLQQSELKKIDASQEYDILRYPEAYYNKGLSLMSLWQHQEAIKNYDLAIKYKPDYADAYNNKGAALINLGKYQEAIETCNIAIKYEPNCVEAYYNKAISLNILKKYQEAITNCDLAIKYDPNYIATYLEKGIALRKLGKYQEAIKNYNLAIKYQSDYAESYLEKGIVLVNLGKQKEAKDNFNLALKYKPNLIEEYEAIIKALRQLGNDLMAGEFEEKLKIMQDNL